MALVVALVGSSGCAEDLEGETRQAERSEEAPSMADAAPTAATAEAPELSFDEIERELANNNAKLRALGVVFADPTTDREFAAEPTAAGETPPAGEAGNAVGKGTTVAPKPDPSPAPKQSPGRNSGQGGGAAAPTSEKLAEDKKQTRTPKRDKNKEEQRGDGFADLDDVVAPEPAKATPLTPNEIPTNLDAAARCQQICDLSEISCSLGDQICELAERHPDAADYGLACERAVDDCEAAKEACDACTE